MMPTLDCLRDFDSIRGTAAAKLSGFRGKKESNSTMNRHGASYLVAA
jgi:hypothetical protein